ncbi:MAG: hypothetical protein M3350_00910 [Actinomycetota bacterium]|nr:hypothetical protein [Actinomycetota bacterium]
MATLAAALVVGIGAGAALQDGGGERSGGDSAALSEANTELDDERAGRKAAEKKLREARDALKATEGRPESTRKAPEPSSETSSDGETQTFSGNGGKILGTVTVPTDSVLEWTNDGNVFQIFSSDQVPVNSQAKEGETALAKGDYKKFQVNAVGNWKIEIRPR